MASGKPDLNNRRNFYRILHVQPEAPLEIIKASYRSLMTKLKAHPDLGGDHEAAVLINQAYAVLSNAEKRQQYDESLRLNKRQVRKARAAPGATYDIVDPLRSCAGAADYVDASPSNGFQQCPFCRNPIRTSALRITHCANCASPLVSAIPIASKHVKELFGRRIAPRISKAGALRIYPSWPHPGHGAQLRDLSPTGIGLLTGYAAQVSQLLKLEGSFFNGIARVITVRAAQGTFSIHASFVTAEFMTKAGSFVSLKV